jgi:hypothetical protein
VLVVSVWTNVKCRKTSCGLRIPTQKRNDTGSKDYVARADVGACICFRPDCIVAMACPPEDEGCMNPQECLREEGEGHGNGRLARHPLGPWELEQQRGVVSEG